MRTPSSHFSRRSVLGGAAGLSAGLALTACSTSGGGSKGGSAPVALNGNDATSGFSDEDFAALKGAQIGVVGINLQGPTVARAVEIMNDLADKHDFKVQAVSTDFDLLKTNDTMRVWSDKGFDGILVANTEAANIGEGLKAAKAAGVPVGGFYCGTAPELAFDVSANEFIAGNKCATYIRQRLQLEGGKKGIAIFGYTPLSNLRERELCIKTQADYYEIPVLFRHEVNADSSAVDVQNRTGDLLTQYEKGGELGAIFVGWDQGGYAAVSALEAAGRDDVFVVSIDGEEANLDSIRNGGPQGATVVNDMIAVSEVCFVELGKLIGGGEPPVNKQFFVDSPLVTAANIPDSGIPVGTGLEQYYVG